MVGSPAVCAIVIGSSKSLCVTKNRIERLISYFGEKYDFILTNT